MNIAPIMMSPQGKFTRSLSLAQLQEVLRTFRKALSSGTASSIYDHVMLRSFLIPMNAEFDSDPSMQSGQPAEIAQAKPPIAMADEIRTSF